MKRSYLWTAAIVVLSLVSFTVPATAEKLSLAPEPLMSLVPTGGKVIGQEVRKADPKSLEDELNGIGFCQGCVCVVCRSLSNGEYLCIEYEFCT